MPIRAWTTLLMVLIVASGCSMGRSGNPTRTPRAELTATDAESARQVDGTSRSEIAVSFAPSSVSKDPQPTPIPTPTPTPTVVTPPAPLAAVVNGQYIFLTDYQSSVAHRKQVLVANGLDPSSEAGQAELAKMRHGVLEEMIDFALIEQGCTNMGLGLDTEDLDEALDADIAAGGGESAFKEWLQGTGQSRRMYREMLRQALLTQMMLEALSAGAADETDSASADSKVTSLEHWLAGQRKTAVIERFVGD